MHLRVADPLADLALRQVVHEAQLDDLALDLGQGESGAGDGVAVLHELVGRVVAAEQALSGIASGRFSTAEEVATLVTLLASPRAGNVTGANYVIDGGLVKTL